MQLNDAARRDGRWQIAAPLLLKGAFHFRAPCFFAPFSFAEHTLLIAPSVAGELDEPVTRSLHLSHVEECGAKLMCQGQKKCPEEGFCYFSYRQGGKTLHIQYWIEVIFFLSGTEHEHLNFLWSRAQK